MAKWLQQVSRWHEMCCHDLEIMSLNPGWVELRVRSTSVPSRACTNDTLMNEIVSMLTECNSAKPKPNF